MNCEIISAEDKNIRLTRVKKKKMLNTDLFVLTKGTCFYLSISIYASISILLVNLMKYLWNATEYEKKKNS